LKSPGKNAGAFSLEVVKLVGYFDERAARRASAFVDAEKLYRLFETKLSGRGSVMLKAKHGLSFAVAAVSVLLLVACGDDDSDFATRPSEGSSSSVCEDCDESLSSSESVILSGDSHEGSSSSSTKSSSSSKVTDKVGEPVEPAEVTTGTMTDSRDGQTYKTVTIGTQTWMAQNLNYAYTDVPYYVPNVPYYVRDDYPSDSTSWCYRDDANNCSKYGRLYTWAAAMDSVGTWSTNGKGCGYNKTCSPTYPVRGVCPEGWHLPTKAEFETLFTAVGGQSTAGKVLKSTSGWKSNGSDAFAFSALPAGSRGAVGSYDYEGGRTFFWISTEYDSTRE